MTVVASICALILAQVVRKTSFKKFIAERFHFSPSEDIWSALIQLDENGSTMRVKLKDKDYFVEGAVGAFGGDDQNLIALAYYSFFEMKENCEPYYTSDDPNKYFVFNVNDVEFIEVWPTIPEEKSQADN